MINLNKIIRELSVLNLALASERNFVSHMVNLKDNIIESKDITNLAKQGYLRIEGSIPPLYDYSLTDKGIKYAENLSKFVEDYHKLHAKD